MPAHVILKGTQGFTLVEIMVAVAILSVVGLAMLQTTQSAYNSLNNVKNLEVVSDAANLIGGLLQDSGFCKSNLGETVFPLPVAPANAIKHDFALKSVNADGTLGANLLAVNQVFPRGIKVKSTDLFIKQHISGDKYLGTVVLNFEANEGLTKNFRREFDLFVVVADAGGGTKKIGDCSRLPSVGSGGGGGGSGPSGPLHVSDILQLYQAYKFKDDPTHCMSTKPPFPLKDPSSGLDYVKQVYHSGYFTGGYGSIAEPACPSGYTKMHECKFTNCDSGGCGVGSWSKFCILSAVL